MLLERVNENPCLEWTELHAGEAYRAVADAHRAALGSADPATPAVARPAGLERTPGAAPRLEIGSRQVGPGRT